MRLTPKTERKKKRSALLEAEIAANVAQVADMRAWYVNERGERELQVTFVGTDVANLLKLLQRSRVPCGGIRASGMSLR